MLTIILYALAACYAIGAVWFLLIERKDGLLKWRLIATALSPIAVPLLALVGIALSIFGLFGKFKKS